MICGPKGEGGHTVKRLVSAMGRMAPMKLKRFLLGAQQNEGTWITRTFHNALNRMPGDRFPTLPCSGILKGYRMKLDWYNNRSYSYGTWETDVVDVLREAIREGFVAYDVGAHIGYYALILSKLVGPRGHVVSFEPVPSSFSFLSENIRMNHLTQAEAHNMAVTDRVGILPFNIPSDVPFPVGGSLLETGAVEVLATSIDEFMRDRDKKLDFLKVDAEGAEALVLKGAQNTIQANHPIIMVEIHHFDGEIGHSTVPDLLQSWGYELRNLDRGMTTSHFLATWKG